MCLQKLPETACDDKVSLKLAAGKHRGTFCGSDECFYANVAEE